MTNQKIIVGVNAGSYTFSASAKTITVSGINTVELENFLLIVNATRNAIIYSPVALGKGGSLVGNVLTLDFDTTSHADTDDIQIHYALTQSTDEISVLTKTKPHSRDKQNEQIAPLVNAAPVIFTVDEPGNKILSTGHGLTAGKVVYFTTTGTLPTPLDNVTPYYVINPTANDFQITTTEGLPAIDITTVGTGVHSYIVAAEFEGAYTKVDEIEHFEIIYASLTPMTSVAKIWSEDGDTPLGGVFGTAAITKSEVDNYNVYYDVNEGRNLAPYYKIKIINGPTDQTLFPGFIHLAWLIKTVYQGTFGTLDAELTQLSRALLTRSVLAGLKPNGTFETVALTSNGSLRTAIPSDKLLSYATPTDPALPSGSMVTIHPVLNTEPNAIDTGWINTDEYPGGNFMTLNADQSLLVYVLNSSDELGNNIFGNLFPQTTTTANLPEVIGAMFFDNFFRIIVVNVSGNTANSLTIQSRGLQSAASPVFTSVGGTVFDAIPAPLTKTIISGKKPDGEYRNVRLQGSDSSNSNDSESGGVLLNAGGVWRGNWFPWQENYVTLVTDLESDVSGSFFIDFSERSSPVNGVDTDITGSLPAISYNPGVQKLLRRHTPIQSKWYRLRYINGPAAQSRFLVDAGLLITASGLPMTPLSAVPAPENLAGMVRSVGSIFNFDKSGIIDVPVDSQNIPKVSISGAEAQLEIKPATTAKYRQLSIGTTATRIDSTPLENRYSIQFENHSLTGDAYWGYDSLVTESNGNLLPARGIRTLFLTEAKQIWVRAKNTGGTTTTLDRLPSNSTGSTATNPNNGLVSDDLYALIPSNGIIEQTAGFTYTPTVNSTIQNVQIVMEASKAPGATSTVVFVDRVTGEGGNTGSISTASPVTSVGGQFYLASISNENITADVTTITGLGLTWVKVHSQSSTQRKIEVWRGTGTPTGNSIVTANFATQATNSHISVARYTGVDMTSPIQDYVGATANTTTPTTSPIQGTNQGMAIMAMAFDNSSYTSAGAGYTIRTNIVTPTGSNKDGLGTQTKPLTVSGPETPSATLNTAIPWATIGLTLRPAESLNPTVTLSYKVSAVTGVTAVPATLTSSTDGFSVIDVTSDRVWVAADIPNVTVVATGTDIGTAAARIDTLYLRVIESTGNVVRVGVSETGK